MTAHSNAPVVPDSLGPVGEVVIGERATARPERGSSGASSFREPCRVFERSEGGVDLSFTL